MQRIVHHDERRRSLVKATWRVIVREGIASATTRGIAREAGCSCGVLAHYFADEVQGFRGRIRTRLAQAGQRGELRPQVDAVLDRIRSARS